jgi:hypothetical protein
MADCLTGRVVGEQGYVQWFRPLSISIILSSAMTLLDAQQYDEARARRRRIWITSILVLLIAIGAFVWSFRYWPEERVVDQFFAALQKQDFESAYRIYHPDSTKYPYSEFYRDWGPGGEWGVVKNYKVFGAAACPHGSSGIVVDVVVNNRREHAQVWVEKSDKSLSTPPCELLFQ